MTSNTGSSTLTRHNTAILIPAFNEAAAISEVIADIRAHCDFPVVVIDDASTDQTIHTAQQAGATVIPLAVQLGAWGAIQTGLRHALRQDYHFVITMDADGQHKAGSLLALTGPVALGKADVTIGACTYRGSRLRKIAWRLIKLASGLSLEDLTSGFRVYNLQAMRLLASWKATLLDYQDVGVLLLLQSQGMKISDVDVQMNHRKNGKSRIFHSWLVVLYYMAHTLLLGLSKRRY